MHANGIAFSPDERTLYHSDTRAGIVVVHDLDGAGRAIGRREIAMQAPGRPDGIAVDTLGGVWVASAGGGRVDRFLPDGTLERSLPVPANIVTSVCFAGDDRRDLVIATADHSENPGQKGSLLRTRVDFTGAPVHPVRI